MKDFNVMQSDYYFESKRFSNMNYDGAWLTLKGNICMIRKGATDNGATWARDENARISWAFHDNAYKDIYCPLTRLQKDLIMLDLLKKEGFAWFRYFGTSGIKMRYVYFIGVLIFGWIRHAK